ncbi:hypothetical protein [Nostoc sp.]|uniref:hypothetical protein n=1 Tax=Nostoc sp. TaxID=1180 RepID=UPI002FF75520
MIIPPTDPEEAIADKNYPELYFSIIWLQRSPDNIARQSGNAQLIFNVQSSNYTKQKPHPILTDVPLRTPGKGQVLCSKTRVRFL